ncbi:MAG: glycerophosphodiester phosphodiesterase [Alphaproteobacteria bacterium]
MTLKIGHRGASAHYPENTLLAFTQAIKMGANAVECDVYLCASGEVVVFHDRTLKRTTNSSGYIARTTLKDLKKLDAGSGEKIPTLIELLDALTPKSTVFVEIKATAAAKPTADIITKFAKTKNVPYERMPVISFKPQHLKLVKSVNKHICVGLTPPERASALNASLIKKAVAAGMWSINPSIKILNKDFVKAAHAANLKVFTWTANSTADIKKATAMGVDGIMSDYPEKL